VTSTDYLKEDVVEYDQAVRTATATWRDLVRDVLSRGQEVRQEGRGHEPRSRTTLELVGHQTRWPMARPLVLCPERKIGRRFAAAEPAWILSGDNRLASILPYARHLANFTDDGVRLSGAYGPKFVDQLPYVVGCLSADPQSRQAVTALWRERPGPSRDIACTLSLQWIVRDQVLCCVAMMRSSDVWLGIPYDVVAFSCMSAAVAIALRSRRPDLVRELGDLVLTAGSQHLYAIDHDAARRCAAADDQPDCAPLDLGEFASERELVDHLRAVADHAPTDKRWLAELAESPR